MSQEKKDSVDFVRSEVSERLEEWQMIDSICDSRKTKKYIIKINDFDDSEENKEFNKKFKQRAVFSAIAGYTSRGFLGLVFDKETKAKIATELAFLTQNADGAGRTLEQLAEEIVRQNIRKGRLGILVDFPRTEGEDISIAQKGEGGYNAAIHVIEARQIINWDTTLVGSVVKLSMVIIRSTETRRGDNNFLQEEVEVIKELRLTTAEDGAMKYSVQRWEQNQDKEWVKDGELSFPTDSAGQAWDEIPFTFVGSETNTPDVNSSPMLPLVELNVAHYNNSALYEDSVFAIGQAQPWMSGLTQSHLEDLGGKKQYFGSRRLIGVPAGEQLGIAQVKENTLAKEAMDGKVTQLVGLGAMFIQAATATKTATQAEGEKRTQHSTLALITNNSTDAIRQALIWAGQFEGVVETGEGFELNKNFVSPSADGNMLREMVAGFIAGAIPEDDYMSWMQRNQFIDAEKKLETFKAEMKALRDLEGLNLDDETVDA